MSIVRFEYFAALGCALAEVYPIPPETPETITPATKLSIKRVRPHSSPRPPPAYPERITVHRLQRPPVHRLQVLHHHHRLAFQRTLSQRSNTFCAIRACPHWQVTPPALHRAPEAKPTPAVRSCRTQVHIPRTQSARPSVIPHRRAGPYLHLEVQVPHQPPQHRHLHCILLPKVSPIGPHNLKQLGHHRRHALESVPAGCAPSSRSLNPPTSTDVVAPEGYITSALEGTNTSSTPAASNNAQIPLSSAADNDRSPPPARTAAG